MSDAQALRGHDGDRHGRRVGHRARRRASGSSPRAGGSRSGTSIPRGSKAAAAELGAEAAARAGRRHRPGRRRARGRGRRGGDGPYRRPRLQRRAWRARTRRVIDYPIDEWKRVFDINVNGLFYCNRFVAKLMKARGYGRIVNIASIAGKEGNPTASRLQRLEGRRSSASPSRSARSSPRTASPSTPSRRRRSRRRSSSRSSAAHIAYMRSKIPMERFGTVEEAAALICWLASRECSFTTGAVFDLSGGRATY